MFDFGGKLLEIVELPNTVELGEYLKKFDLPESRNEVSFRIYGGLMGDEFHNILKYQNRITYSFSEAKAIEERIVKIVGSIPKKWNTKQKILYIYDYVRRNIHYNTEYDDDRAIRSLLVICTRYAVCSGYALLFTELLARIDITSQYVKMGNHIWNRVYLDKRWIDVDLTWDSCVFEKTKTNYFHYFSNCNEVFKYHEISEKYFINEIELLLCMYSIGLNTQPITRKIDREDGTFFLLAQLPFKNGYKLYFYRERGETIVAISDDDFEIILSQGQPEVLSCYCNTFFEYERIKRHAEEGYSYIGRGIFLNNCFYRSTGNDRKDDMEIKVVDIIGGKRLIYKERYRIDVQLVNNEFIIGEIKNVNGSEVGSIEFNN